MRIVVVTQGLSSVVRPLVTSGHEVIGLVESAPRGSAISHRRLRRLVSSVLTAIMPSRLNLEQFARRSAIPYFWLENASMDRFGMWLEQASPDLMVVFSMSQLLPKKVFTTPRLGTINLHPSFLPEYRGPNPDFWQYHDFLPYGGVTVHHIDAGEDTGDVIEQARVPISPGTISPLWNRRVVDDVGVQLLVKAIDDLEAGRASRRPQPERSPTVRARRIKADEHTKIIDWATWPIERVWHVLRGTQSWLRCIPEPTGIYAGQTWMIGDFVPGAASGEPGSLRRDDLGYYIACRDGRIRLSVEFSAKRALRRLLSAG